MERDASFGAWLAERRKALRLSRVELARRVSCATVTLRKIEEDARRPSPELAAALAEQLGISVADRATFVRVARGELRVERLPMVPPVDVRETPGSLASVAAVPRQHLRTNLPAPLTSFVGRSQELVELPALLATQRLVTLTGVGGVGKTRLATEVGIRLVRSGLPDLARDGVWMVELAPLAQPALVAQAIANAFRLPEQSGRPMLELLQDHLADKQLLLFLDNCEHLVEVCAEIAQQLLLHCWQLRILVTSRELLRVPGECVYPLQPLTLPSVGDEQPTKVLATSAAQLFVARMETGAAPIDSVDATAVAQICRQLDGIPLAIELAAPLSHIMGLAEVAGQLQNQMTILNNTYRTAIPRHQTMHSALLWSYRLLAPAEQQVLASIAVFAGGWTLDAAQAVCEDGLSERLAGHVHQLVAKSLVLREEQGGHRRYRLLEPVRQFAQGQLASSGEEERARQRHAKWILELVEQVEPHFDGLERARAIALLKSEDDNIRLALGWFQATNQNTFGLRLAGALWQFWVARRQYTTGQDWLAWFLSPEQNCDRHQVISSARAKALIGAGTISNYQGNTIRAGELLTEGLAVARAVSDTCIVAWALNELGEVAFRQDDYVQARAYREESLALFRTRQNHNGMVLVLGNIGRVARETGDYAQATAFFQESLALARALGDVLQTATALKGLGTVERRQGRLATARTLYEQSLALCRTIDDHWGIALCLDALGSVAQRQSDDMLAVTLFQECLVLYREFGDWRNVAFVLRKLGLAAFRLGDLDLARTRLAESLSLFQAQGKPKNIAYAMLYAGLATLAGHDYVLARMHLRGAAVHFHSLKQHEGLTEALTGLALAAYASGDLERSSALLTRAEACYEGAGIPTLLGYQEHLESLLQMVRAELAAGVGSTRLVRHELTLEQLLVS